MFFNWTKSFSVLVGVLAVSTLLSCASERNSNSDNKTIDVGLGRKGEIKGQLYCLGEFSEHFVQYFSGELSRQQLTAFWSCTARAVEVFQEYAKPDARGMYRAEYVRNFLQEYFWQDLDFNDELLREFMLLKKILFGGEETSFSRQDLINIQNFLGRDLNSLTTSLLDEIPFLISGILTGKHPNLTEDRLNRSVFKFRKVMAEFGRVFSRNGYGYSFDRMSKLFKGVKPLLLDANRGGVFARLETLVPILQETKVLLVGPDRSQILPTEWSDFFGLIANAYVLWVRSENFIAGEDITKGSALSQFYTLVDEILFHIHSGISRRLDKVYSHNEAELWLRALSDVAGIPFGLDLDLLLEYWPWVVDKILVPGDTEKNSQVGLTPAKISFAQEKFRVWKKTQERINLTHGEGFNIHDPHLGLLQKIFRETDLNLSFDNEGRVVTPNTGTYYDRGSLSLLNFVSIGVELIIRAYAEDIERRLITLSLDMDEANFLVSDLQRLLVRLNLLNPKDQGFVSRLYRDANLFVPHANGDKFIDFNELVVFLHYVMSGYNNLNLMKGSKIKGVKIYDCEFKDSQGASFFTEECVGQVFISNLELLTGHLPQLRVYLRGLHSKNPGQFWSFFSSLARTVLEPFSIPGRLTEGELLKFHVLLQYIETFIYRFDSDKSGELSPLEVHLFLDRFMEPISKLLGQNGEGVDDFVRSFFTYAVKYHKSPLDTSDHASSLRFHVWSKTRDSWNFQASRYDLSFVLAILGSL